MSDDKLVRPEFTETQAIAALEACKREGIMALRGSPERKAWFGAEKAIEAALTEARDA